MLEELEKDKECGEIGEDFEREYELRKLLILTRKKDEITKKELRVKSFNFFFKQF